jgi:hypothetical protein
MDEKKLIESSSVETRLEKAFQPVRPSRQFVQRIRKRIRLAPSVVVAERLNETSHIMLLIAGSITVVLLVVTAVRAIFYLTNKSR